MTRSGLPNATACLIVAVDRMARERRAAAYVTYRRAASALALARVGHWTGGCALWERLRGADGRIRLQCLAVPQAEHEARRAGIVALGMEAHS